MTDINNNINDRAFAHPHLYGTHAEAAYGGALSFARRRYSRDLTGVDVAITGIPFDTATSNRSGARLGPRAVRAASSQLAWARPYPWKFDPFDRLAVVDYGDCLFDYGRPQDTPAAIEAHTEAILAAGAASLTLGGDHYITYPILKAYARRHGPMSIIHFDAHSDTWADEPGRIDHGTMLYHAVKEGIVDPKRSIQIGLRTTNDDNLGFNIIDGTEARHQSAAQIAQKVLDIVGQHPTYLTFDIDCLDPACAPGTGTPVCGGLTSGHALDILRGLTAVNLVGMDVVEVAPAYDVSEITALAGASIAMEMLCLYASRWPDKP